jgi:PEP-CTERM motif
MATTVSEPPNFGTTFGTATDLPDGTTEVDGSVQFPGDTNDYFTFQDLVPGSGFYFTASTTSSPGLELNLLTSGDAALPGSSNPYTFTASDPDIVTGLSAPSDGIIVFDVLTPGGEGPARAYTIDITTSTYVPEPGTLGAMGLGLAAGAALLRRRRKKI